MEQVNLQEPIDLVVVMELFTTLLKMLDLVETCVLNLRRKKLLHLTTVNISHKDSGGAHAIDVLLERA
jgi:hypothetical protein